MENRIRKHSKLPRRAWVCTSPSSMQSHDSTSLIPRPNVKKSNSKNKYEIPPNDSEEFSLSPFANVKQKRTPINSHMKALPIDSSGHKRPLPLLAKSQSLNEIEHNNLCPHTSSFIAADDDAVKAFSLEQLSNNEMASSLRKSSLEMSIDESSTASLGLIPGVLCSSSECISPFDVNPNIPIKSYKSGYDLDSDTIDSCNVLEMGTQHSPYGTGTGNKLGDYESFDDDSSEKDIPIIEEESDNTVSYSYPKNITRPVTPLIITDALSNYDANDTFDATMECAENTVVIQDMAMELEIMNLEPENHRHNIASKQLHNNNGIVESEMNESDNHIPYPIESSKKLRNNDNAIGTKEIVTLNNEMSSLNCDSTAGKQLNNCMTINNNKNAASSVTRAHYLEPKGNHIVAVTESVTKVQRPVSPSSTKAPLRKKIKTPGRWDSVNNKIASGLSKDKGISTKVVKSKIDTNLNLSRNLSRTATPVNKISPLSDTAESSSFSSHTSPTTINATVIGGKSSHTSLVKKTVHGNLNKTIAAVDTSQTKNAGINSAKVTIPKSSTFIREINTNIAAGNDTTRASHTAKRDTASLTNDKKVPSRRATNAHSLTVTAKKVQSNKLVSSSGPKRDSRPSLINTDASKQQIQTLSQLCEAKEKQLNALSYDYNYLRIAFDAYSIVIRHLIEQYDALENPNIRWSLENANKRCEKLTDKLDLKDIEITDLKQLAEEQSRVYDNERAKFEADLRSAKMSHRTFVTQMERTHNDNVKLLQNDYAQQLELFKKIHKDLESQIEVKSNELIHIKQENVMLQNRVTQMEENLLQDKDKKFKYLNNSKKQLENDVLSLNVVLEMKNEKIHTLERNLTEAQETIEELQIAKEAIRGLHQKVENLQAMIDKKTLLYNQLTHEHENLRMNYERECIEKRRLSIKAEELEFHLNESIYGESPTNGTNNDAIAIRSAKKTPAFVDETPVRMARSYSATTSSHSKFSAYGSSVKRTPALYCSSSRPGSGSASNDFLFNGKSDDDDHSIRGNDFRQNTPMKTKMSNALSSTPMEVETPPQCILDSGFEDIHGLNSLQHK